MRKQLLKAILVLVFLGSIISAKAQTWTWAKSGKGTSLDEGWSVSTDNSGNAFITGDFLSPTITFGAYTLTSSGSTDVFLAKYDPSGNVLWARSAGPTYSVGYSVCNDGAGNSFITGSFSGPTIAFGTYTLTKTGNNNLFLAKYDPNGNVLWAKNSIATGGSIGDGGFSVSADAGGNVFVTGHFDEPALTLGSYTLTNSGTGTDMFIAKYNLNGNVLWAKQAGGIKSDEGYSNYTDASGNVVVTGYFNSPTIVFGTYTLTNNSTLPLGSNTFIVKYDMNGNVLWAKSAGGIKSDQSYALCLDAGGNAFVTGSFSSPTITFGTYTLINNGSTNAFFVKYDPNGNVLFAKNTGGSANERGYGVSVSAGDVFVTGGLSSPSVVAGAYTLSPTGTSFDDMFIIHYDLVGNVLYATTLEGGGDDQNAVKVDKFCNAYITGDFIPNPFNIGTNVLTPSGTENVFLARMAFSCQADNVNQLEGNNEFYLAYPNPNNGSFILKINTEIKNGEIIIYNSLGQKISRQDVFAGENKITMNGFAKGVYHYEVFESKERVYYHKFILE